MKILIGLALIFSSSAMADLKNCSEGVGEFGNLGNMRYQIGSYRSNGKCFISIGPNNRYPEYRSYNFDSKGELMVFNSLGDGRPSTDTGARSFFFPVTSSDLKYELDFTNEYIQVQATDGRVWKFDARSSKIESIEDMTFIEDPEVNRNNKGGLELTPTRGYLIDEGWRLGGPPNIILTRNSTIKNSQGDLCIVKNKKIFKHELDSRGRVDGAYFIYPKTKDWMKFLAKNCDSFGL